MPVYFFAGVSERVMGGLRDNSLRTSAIKDTDAHIVTLAEIDARALVVEREKHHRYLINEAGTTGILLYLGSECVGYAYIASNGHIGPLAVTRADILGDAFTTALKVATDGKSERISAFLPGTCESSLSLAVNYGMRITFPMLLMASPGYGDWTNYLPRNPGFM
jgi:hypothetical protein